MRCYAVCLAVQMSAVVFSQASADGCRRSQTYVPTYTYQQTYHAPHHDYQASAFLYVPVPTFPIYGVGYGAGDELRLLREELLQLRRELYRPPQQPVEPMPPAAPPGNLPPVLPPQQQPAKPVLPPQGSTLPPQGGGQLKAHRMQDPEFNAYIRANCTSCHGTTPAKGAKFSLMLDSDTNNTLIDNGPLASSQIYVRLSFSKGKAGHMPKGGDDCPEKILDKASLLALNP